jgi:hypothetical protein
MASRVAAGILGAVVLVATGTTPAGSAAPVTIEPGPYGGLDDADHPVTFVATAHHVGHFHFGAHHHAMDSIPVHHGAFHDCLVHVCFLGGWHQSDTVVGAWRHRDSHARWHSFVAHAYR